MNQITDTVFEQLVTFLLEDAMRLGQLEAEDKKDSRPPNQRGSTHELTESYRKQVDKRKVEVLEAFKERHRQGIRSAASIADTYNSSSGHEYLLGDCIMGKLNLMGNKKPRKNRTASGKTLHKVLVNLFPRKVVKAAKR